MTDGCQQKVECPLYLACGGEERVKTLEDELYDGLREFRYFANSDLLENQRIAEVKLSPLSQDVGALGPGLPANNRIARFTTLGWFGVGSALIATNDEPNGVIITYNDAAKEVRGTTVGDHQLVGIRRWQVSSVKLDPSDHKRQAILERVFKVRFVGRVVET